MKTYKMVLCYDGSRYNGWQKQGNTDNTLQEKLEKILTEIAGVETEIAGSGRTDAGTHAKGQVASFRMDWKRTAAELLTEINGWLPEDVGALSLEEAEPRFHARLNAKAKRYVYTIWTGEMPPVFWRKYSFWCKDELDVEAMKEAASAFVGTHDFKSFCANKRMKKSTVRTIYDINIEQKEQRLVLSFTGNGFLYQMVRILTGTLIEVGEGKRSSMEMEEILAAENREAAGFTAPSRGLMLDEVFYEPYGKGTEMP